MSKARNNAELILECAELGYLRSDIPTLDPTWGLGRFWAKWQPTELYGTDLLQAKSPSGFGSVDFTKLDGVFALRPFGQVVFDGPYKLNGTSTGEGPSASDEDYGVDGEYKGWKAKHQLLKDGITSCLSVLRPKGMLLVKCQDQVCCGAVRWQTMEFTRHAESLGCTLVDMLHLQGGRKQPEGRTKKCQLCKGADSTVGTAPCPRCEGAGRVPSVQEHASRNYSTLLVLQGPPAKVFVDIECSMCHTLVTIDKANRVYPYHGGGGFVVCTNSFTTVKGKL